MDAAWCDLLFINNGGQLKQDGTPDFGKKIVLNEKEVEDGADPIYDDKYARGLCRVAYDCGSCSIMGSWLTQAAAEGWVEGWECGKCLKETEQADAVTVYRQEPGFYQSGRNPDVSDPFHGELRIEGDPHYVNGFDNRDDDHPAIIGCTRCGWESSFLQLVLRKPKT